MTAIKAFIKRHPVLTYFALTFAISWGGVLLVIGGPGGRASTAWQSDPRLPFMAVAMLAGPSVSGMLSPPAPPFWGWMGRGCPCWYASPPPRWPISW